MKRAAPIIVIIIVCAWIFLWTGGAALTGVIAKAPVLSLVIIISGIAVIAALLFSLVKRMNEIDKEDDEDLKKY